MSEPRPPNPSEDRRVDDTDDDTYDATAGATADAFGRNFAATPPADPTSAELTSTDALQARLEGLARQIQASGGEAMSPSPVCYNDPTSEGDGAQPSPQARRPAKPPADEGVSMKLQACTKCGAQFDVSGFTPSQQFSCGACGEVLTAPGAAAPAAPAAAAPSRTPGAPKQGRTPGAPRAGAPKAGAPKAGAPKRGGAPSRGGPKKAVAGGPAAPARGPQYQPVQRATAPGAASGKGAASGRGAAASKPGAPAGRKRAPAGRHAAAADEGEGPRGRRGARPAAGPNKGLLIGAGAVVLLVVVLLVVLGGDNDDVSNTNTSSTNTSSNGGGAEAGKGAAASAVASTETLRDVMGEYATERPTQLRPFRAFISRIKRIEGDKAKKALRGIYEDFIEGPGRDDQEARTFLGYKEFAHEIPEDIANREYPYLKAVTAAYNTHWFAADEDEEYAIAMRAWKKTEEHYDRLLNDHHFLAADSIRANIAKDKFFKDYNYAARWADPYLICYASTDRLSEYDLLSIEDKDERRLKIKELRKKREEYEKILDEKEMIFTQLYKEFYSRYKDTLSLKPLMDKYGGRPDYPIGVRTFAEGSPMVVWIFDSKKSFNEYHTKVSKKMIPHNVAGYFSPMTTYVYLYDEADSAGNRVFEINKNVHEGTHQLEFWFTRQRNRWRKPRPGQDWFGEGIAEYMGSVKMGSDGKLEFTGVNVPRLKSMHAGAKRLESQGQKYPKFPVERLVSFNSYGEVKAWGSNEWSLRPDLVLLMFYEQSWGFTYFLNRYDNGKYKKRFEKFFDLVLHRETGVSKGSAAFREAFRIQDEDDWEDLNDEYHEFIDEVLMKMDLREFEYSPPARGSITADDDEEK